MKKKVAPKEIKENKLKFQKVSRFRPAQTTVSRVASSERLDNHGYRNYRDNQILKKIRPNGVLADMEYQQNYAPIKVELSVDEIHDCLFKKPPLKGYWKYCDEMSNNPIPAVRQWDGIFTKDLDSRIPARAGNREPI